MKAWVRTWCGMGCLVMMLLTGENVLAQPAESPATEDPTEQEAVEDTAGGDATAPEPEQLTAPEPQVLEKLVDQTLHLAHVETAGNTPMHYAIAAGILLSSLLLRRFVVRWVFHGLQSLAGYTRTEFDERLLRAAEKPAKALVALVGIVAALRVLKLPPAGDIALRWVSAVAFSILVLALFLRVVAALLDQAQQRAQRRELNVAAFMPWIRRTLLAVVMVLGVLMIAQSLGANVRAFLAGLGIGGLAVALAAQDTLANIFGSVVIAIDQPFRVGETVQIGPHIGTVEDMGLRSTRLRTPARNLITIPNKMVAAEAISNLTRFSERRVEQTIRLAYGAEPEQIESLVEAIRGIIQAEDEVSKPSVIVQFTEFGPVSLDVWVVYQTQRPDFFAQLRLKQRINFAIMRAMAARGLRFAPTQRVQLGETEKPAAA
jgi:MscS family membrane protein